MNLRDLDLNLLVVFQAIWLDRNVSTAAERLDMTQSASNNPPAKPGAFKS